MITKSNEEGFESDSGTVFQFQFDLEKRPAVKDLRTYWNKWVKIFKEIGLIEND